MTLRLGSTPSLRRVVLHRLDGLVRRQYRVCEKCVMSFSSGRDRGSKARPDPNEYLALEEGEQVGVDDVGLRRDHPVRVVLVCLQRAVLKELG
jgi:hypothetical protein